MYSPLEDRDALFRLVHLLPGSFSDDLKVQIVHVSFVHQTSQPQQARLSLNAVQKTLPQGWEVHESLQGRYIFQRHDPFWTTWTHPDPNVPRETWDLPDDPEFEPKYEALSYTWGSPNNRQSLQIVSEDGDDEPRELMIQESLSLALRHLRLADEVRTLWIDFLSINQGDLPECGFEVGRMSEIYKQADRVVVWLGPSSESSKGALSTLEAYAGQFELTRTNGSLPYPDSPYSTFPWPNCAHDRTGQEIGTNRQLWEPIFDLLNRPWFDRLWVMQEIQLASKRSIIQCGLDSIRWPLFQRAVLCLRYQGNLRRDLASRLSRLVGLLSSARDCDFLRLLVKAQPRLCSEPRDKVYGILGLTPPRMRTLIHPTYTEPVVSVYKDAFLALMKETNRLESLSLCMKQSGRLFERPSWVPDWSVSQHKVRHTANTVNLTSAFSSAQATLHSEDVLEVQGVQFGTVRDVKSPAPRTDMECIHSIYSWAPRDYPFDRYPNGEDLWDAFAATLLIDRVRSRFVHDIPSMQTASEWGEALRHHSLGALLELSGSGAVNEAFSLKDSIQFVMGRAFITTDDGIFALGPEATQPGDILCTILGCDENMILRPLGNNQFEVVGPCYAHAYSDGEALLGTVPQPWQVKFMHDRGSGLELASFYNQVTSETTEEDPRLWALPLGWRKIHRERTEDDPMSFSWFFHEERAELVNYDPRLLPDQLKDRGVAIRSFMLI